MKNARKKSPDAEGEGESFRKRTQTFPKGPGQSDPL